MSFLKQFSIQFAGLKEGTYNFEFVIDEKFFEKFEETEINKGRVDVGIEVRRELKLLDLTFELKGNVALMCDRCLDNFDYTFEASNKLIVNLGTEKSEETDEIITIPEADGEINVAQYIYEFIHLTLPTKRVHPDDEDGFSFCNKEIIEKLNEYQIKENKNTETDPRWDELKKLKFNKN